MPDRPTVAGVRACVPLFPTSSSRLPVRAREAAPYARVPACRPYPPTASARREASCPALPLAPVAPGKYLSGRTHERFFAAAAEPHPQPHPQTTTIIAVSSPYTHTFTYSHIHSLTHSLTLTLTCTPSYQQPYWARDDDPPRHAIGPAPAATSHQTDSEHVNSHGAPPPASPRGALTAPAARTVR